MSRTGYSRRAALAGVAGGVAATSGCLGEVRNLVGRQRAQQISLSIATLPTDNDPYALEIATKLADHMTEAGLDVGINPMDPEVLLRDILINHEFDMYVAPYPSERDPDLLRSLLHSTYGEEGGWQNPFGFSNLTLNDLLDEQRMVDGARREEIVGEIQEFIVREQPFTVVAFPDVIAATRSDRFVGWPKGGIQDPLAFLQLERISSDVAELTLLTRDRRITTNLNPIAAEYRDRGDVTGLLYEPLVRGPNRDIPWLAWDVSWSESGGLSATVTLREASWHDDESILTHDVEFTYRFLADTSLGEKETPVPTPWRRGRVSLVDAVSVVDDRVVSIEFSTNVRAVAERALTVPILPRHIWEEKSSQADLAGIDIIGGTTEALVWPNDEPIGSGPLQFVESTTDEQLVLERFEDHFLDAETERIPERLRAELPFDSVVFNVVPSHDAAVDLLDAGDADGTLGGLREGVVPRIARTDDVDLSVATGDAFYHVGYNCRQSPLTDPQFRRAIAKLIHRESLVEDVFGGYAVPAESPLEGSPWILPELQWDGEGQLEFPGTDGTLDVDRARENFREAGYQYDGDRLVSRGDS